MKKYNLECIIINKLSKKSIPYFIGMVIVGPKGGRYFLDVFNCEYVLKKQTEYGVLNRRTEDIIYDIQARTKRVLVVKVNYNSEKELNNMIRDNLNCVVLERKNGIRKSDIIANSINFDILDKELYYILNK